MISRKLEVTVTASTEAAVLDMVEALARAACDVSNSTDDDESSISVVDIEGYVPRAGVQVLAELARIAKLVMP